jgi:hypothetical protein
MRIIKPIVTGEHFLEAESAQCDRLAAVFLMRKAELNHALAKIRQTGNARIFPALE